MDSCLLQQSEMEIEFDLAAGKNSLRIFFKLFHALSLSLEILSRKNSIPASVVIFCSVTFYSHFSPNYSAKSYLHVIK